MPPPFCERSQLPGMRAEPGGIGVADVAGADAGGADAVRADGVGACEVERAALRCAET